MNKEQKAAVVEELSKELSDAEAIFAIDYRGISVPQAAELREGLRDADARFRVVKNRLTLRAADAAGTAEIKDYLSGPTALALVGGDPALAAKTIASLGSEWELLDYKGGIMEGAALDPDCFQAIAKLPGREQLNAQARRPRRQPVDRAGPRARLDGPGPGDPAQPDRREGARHRRGPAEEAPAEEAPAEEGRHPPKRRRPRRHPPKRRHRRPRKPSRTPSRASRPRRPARRRPPRARRPGRSPRSRRPPRATPRSAEAQEEAQDETSEDSDEARRMASRWQPQR